MNKNIKKRFLIALFASMFLNINVQAGGLFDEEVSSVENFLRFQPVTTAFNGQCISNVRAYEDKLANRSIDRFQELEEQHQKKVDEVAKKISSFVVKDSEENLKNYNIIVALQQQQALAEKQRAFLMGQINQIQNIVIDIRAID